MKKILVSLLVAMVLTACQQTQEQLDLKAALVNKLKDDSDLKDYKIDPKDLAECVFNEIAENAPGIPGDVKRNRYFEAFTKFITVSSPSDAEKAVKDYQDLFGGVHETHQAATSVTDHIMSCMGGAVDAAKPQ